MYDWEYEILELTRNLKIKTNNLSHELKRYPNGHLLINNKQGGKRIEYYHQVYCCGKYTRKYLSPTKDQTVINLLTEKRTKYQDILNELNKTESAYQLLYPLANTILRNYTSPTENGQPSVSENPKYPEYLRYLTNRGEKVRSMSEKIIADSLFKYKINYKYEKELNLSDNCLYPDFTIINPLNNRVYYWEHLGLSSEEYKKSWEFKHSKYAEHHITTETNLIISRQEDLNHINKIIENQFTIIRYSCLL